MEGTGGHRRPWDGCYCRLEQCKMRHEPNFILTQGVFCWAPIKMLLYILHIHSKPTVPHHAPLASPYLHTVPGQYESHQLVRDRLTLLKVCL